jgi:hypothetical protein
MKKFLVFTLAIVVITSFTLKVNEKDNIVSDPTDCLKAKCPT